MLEQKSNIVMDEQHEDMEWFSLDQLENNDMVHQNTKNYIPMIKNFIALRKLNINSKY